jgi:hypothetical protein
VQASKVVVAQETCWHVHCGRLGRRWDEERGCDILEERSPLMCHSDKQTGLVESKKGVVAGHGGGSSLDHSPLEKDDQVERSWKVLTLRRPRLQENLRRESLLVGSSLLLRKIPRSSQTEKLLHGTRWVLLPNILVRRHNPSGFLPAEKVDVVQIPVFVLADGPGQAVPMSHDYRPGRLPVDLLPRSSLHP